MVSLLLTPLESIESGEPTASKGADPWIALAMRMALLARPRGRGFVEWQFLARW